MTDSLRPPFILPDSVLKRRRGLLEGAMPNPSPRQQAEYLELLSEDDRLTSTSEMLGLMRGELDRLKSQIDQDDEPDRYSETVLAAATADFIEEKAMPEQRANHREVYFAILLGYLYGRLTKPGGKHEKESTTAWLKLHLDRERRAKGGQTGRTLDPIKFENAWLEWVSAGSSGTKGEFDNDMAQRFNVSEKTIEFERLKLQRKHANVFQNMDSNP